MAKINLETVTNDEDQGKRLDQTLAKHFQDYSREQLKNWIKAGQVTVNGDICKTPKQKVVSDAQIVVDAELAEQVESEPEAIPLNIVYEDDSIIIINKPAGLVVHPGAGNPRSTMMNALLYYYPALAEIPRAGIIHRLDKSTTGLMVIAKTLAAHNHLVKALEARDVKRFYKAVVCGKVISGSTVDAPIARHPHHRVHMAVVESGKPAVTHYRVLEKFKHHTLIQCQLETGRTHQIRVHMAHIGFPIVGDPVYNKRLRLPKNASEALIEMLQSFKRQALHAYQLGLEHPVTGEWMEWQAPLPEDFEGLLEVLRNADDTTS